MAAKQKRPTSLHNIAQSAEAIKLHITEGLDMYQTTAKRLQECAALAMHHACQNGDVVFLNMLHDGMRVNDQQAFRWWVGKFTDKGFHDPDSKHTGGNIKLFGFRKGEFFAKARTAKDDDVLREAGHVDDDGKVLSYHELRQQYSIEDIVSFPHFMDVNQSKEIKALTLVGLYEQIARLGKKINNTLEDDEKNPDGIVMDPKIKERLDALVVMSNEAAAKESAKAEATANDNEGKNVGSRKVAGEAS